VRSDEISHEIATLQEEIAAVRATEEEDRSALDTLEAQLSELRYGLTLARGALEAHQKQLDEKRAELEEAVAQEAQERFEQVKRERDAAGAALAKAAELLLERLAEFDRSQDAARGAWATAHARDAADRGADLRCPSEITAEPEVLSEAWDRLCAEIRNRINERFEDELVDAASRSSLGGAIDELPLHLQELARQRRRAIVRRARDAEFENGIG
jgi:hypothetical protein